MFGEVNSVGSGRSRRTSVFPGWSAPERRRLRLDGTETAREAGDPLSWQVDPHIRIAIGAALFSTGAAAIKLCSLTGWQIAGFRSGVAAVALLLLLPSARRRWNWRTILVGFSYAATLILYVLANKATTAASTIFLQSTAPLYVLVLGPWLLTEPLRRQDMWFIAVLAIGIGLFFVHAEPMATAPRPLYGNVLAGLAGLAWGLTIVGLRWIARSEPPGATSPAAAVVAGNLIVFLTCAPWAFPVTGDTSGDWLLILILGVFQIALAYAFVLGGMRRVSALEASLFLLIEPVFSPLWAWLLLRETPGYLAVVGGCLILGATVVRTCWAAKQSHRGGPCSKSQSRR